MLALISRSSSRTFLLCFFLFVRRPIRAALTLPLNQMGDVLNYDEVVVYDEDAAMPTYLVVYTTD